MRQPLINALHLRFPELVGEPTDLLYATTESIDGRRGELKRLLDEEIPANRRAIEEARALGDLRENFEYKSARQRHEYLSARAAALDGDLRRVRVISPDGVDTSEVRIGSMVDLVCGDKSRQVIILGPWESDPEAGIFSYESDFAKGLLGKAPGDEVEDGVDIWRVDAIAPVST